MSILAALAEVASRKNAARKLLPLARYIGAYDVLLFIRDPELNVFLPPPGLPQTLPEGGEWQEFLRNCPESDCRAALKSPYTLNRMEITGRRIGQDFIIVTLGGEPDAAKWEEVCGATPVLLPLFETAYRAQIAEAEAKLASEAAREARILARTLLDTRQKLESALTSAEEQRHHAEEINRRLRMAQEMALMGVWEWNIQTGQVYWSDEVHRIHGIHPSRFRGNLTDVLEHYHPEDRERVRTALNAALDGGASYDIEFRILASDGSTKWISARARVDRDEHGAARRMLGFTMDITRRKSSEDALRRSERLAAAGRLAATIAHEINNPLESITNLIYLLRADKSLSPSAQKYVEVADGEIARVSQISRQTLAFYRDTSTPVPVDLQQLLREVLALYENKLKESGVEVETRFAVAKPLVGLRGELKQLFANLVSNALDAMPGGGELVITVLESAREVVVSLSDSGAGISADVLPKLFEPFFTTKQHVGTGLGLWVSKGIAEKHGGTILVESSTRPEDHGTTFRVLLGKDTFADLGV